MKNLCLLSLVAILTLSSCSKFLDGKPVGKLIPTKVEEFDNILNNISTIDFHLSDYNKGSTLTGLSDMICMSDNVIKYFYSASSVVLDRMASYIFSTPYLNYSAPDENLVFGCYKAVGLLNNIVDGIVGIGKEEDPYGKEVIAQAKAARAWSMFVTGISYCPSYDPVGANDAKTIPYRVTADPNIPNPQLSTVAELFDNVERDLLFAAEFCPDRVANPVRANKATANALLAMVYMYKGDFVNMYKYARIAWDTQLANVGGDVNRLLYNYNTDIAYEKRDPLPKVEPGVDVRTELAIESVDNIHDKSYGRENMFYRISVTASYVDPSEKYLSLLVDGDMRKELFLLMDRGFRRTYPGAGVGGTDLKIDDGISLQYYRSYNMIDNLGITHAELLLMLAESAARMNKPSEAMTALRTLRQYRYTPETSAINDLSGDQLIQEVLNERVREMPIFSPHRAWDLKRFARENGKPWVQKSISRVVLGETLTADINSEKYQLEIGNSHRISNPHWRLALIPGVWAPYKYGNPFQ